MVNKSKASSVELLKLKTVIKENLMDFRRKDGSQVAEMPELTLAASM